MNNGQDQFLEQMLDGVEESKAKIIKIAVELYIQESEAKIKLLEESHLSEKLKNKDIKELAEKLARDLLKLSPNHPLAEQVLTLLLESQMKGEDASGSKRAKK